MALNQDIPTGRIALMDLIDPGGALHAYPRPILLLDRQNRIAAANPAGAGLSHNILTDEAASTLAMVEAARDGAPCTDKVIDAATGEITDLVALPAGEGEHVLLCGRDISLDQNLRDALVDSRQRYKDLVEVSSDFAWETDEAGKFAFVSPAGVLGLMPDQLIGRAAIDFIPRIEGLDVISPFDTRQRLEEVEFQFTSADGSHATLGGAATPLFDPGGNWRGARGVCRDITEDRTRQEALGRIRDRERLLNFITRAIRNEVEPHAMLDAAATVIRRASSVDGCMVVRRDAMADNKPVRGALSGDASDIINPELIDVTDDGDGKPTVEERDGLRLLSVAASYHRAVNGGLVLWRASDGPAWSEHEIDQITRVAPQIAIALQQVAAHLDLERLSSTDMLTGLYNRRSFVDLLTGRIEGESDLQSQPGALAYVDLNNFKQVNDILGHQAGDDALVRVSAMLKSEARDGDIVTRLGGDEFAIWMERSDQDEATRRGEGLLAASLAMRGDFSPNPEKPFGLSVGMACFVPGSGETLVVKP